jgi:hypothetical protein
VKCFPKLSRGAAQCIDLWGHIQRILNRAKTLQRHPATAFFTLSFKFRYLRSVLYISPRAPLFHGAHYWTQGFMLDKKVLYHLNCAPSPFVFISFLRYYFCNSSQAYLKLVIILPLPPEYLGHRHAPPLPALWTSLMDKWAAQARGAKG